MLSKLNGICINSIVSLDIHNEKLMRANKFRKLCCSLNESVEDMNSLVSESNEDELPNYINTLIQYVNSFDGYIPMENFKNIVDEAINIATKSLAASSTNILASLSTLIAILHNDSQNINDSTSNREKENYLFTLYKLLSKMQYVSNNISDEPYLISPDEMNKIRNYGDNEKLKVISDIIQDKYNTNNSTLLSRLEYLDNYFELLSNSTGFDIENTNILLNYIYHSMIDDVSGMRRFHDILEDCIGILQKNKEMLDTSENSDIIDKIIQSSSDMLQRTNDRPKVIMNECISFKYDILTEMGLDYLYDVCTKDDEGDYIINEAAIMDKAKELKVKAKATDKRLSRKVDNSVQRVIDDIRDGMKEDAEDKMVKQTIRASKILKTLIVSGGLLLLPNIGPTLSAIFLITKFAIKKTTELKYRQRLLNDLKEELRIVEEKVRDADRNGSNTAKYRLMRLESQLKRSIDNVQYHLKD